jgi:hypothetical protein
MAEWKAATRIWQRLEQAAQHQESWPQYLSGLVGFARYEYRRAFLPDPWRQFDDLRLAAERLLRCGGQRDACAGQISLGQAHLEIGDVAGGVQQLEQTVQLAERLRQPYIVLIARVHLMAALGERSDTTARALKLASEILSAPTAGDGFRGWAHTILGQDRLRNGALEQAAEHLRTAVALSQTSPLRRLHAASLQVHLLLQKRQHDAARSLAEELLVEAAARGGGGYCAPTIGLAAICARFAAGDEAGASELHRTTASEVTRRALGFPDSTSRARYLRELRENAILLSPTPWLGPFPGLSIVSK